jgi:hypothetical protein
MVEIAHESNPALPQAFARDELVASLLLLYDLHPEDFATRVQRAVDAMPYVELVAISERNVRVKLAAPVPRETLEDVIYAAAPETEEIEVEGATAAGAAFVPVGALLRA